MITSTRYTTPMRITRMRSTNTNLYNKVKDIEPEVNLPIPDCLA